MICYYYYYYCNTIIEKKNLNFSFVKILIFFSKLEFYNFCCDLLRNVRNVTYRIYIYIYIYIYCSLILRLPQTSKHREIRRLQIQARVPCFEHDPRRRHRTAAMLLASMDLSLHYSQEGEAGLKLCGLLRVVRDNV